MSKHTNNIKQLGSLLICGIIMAGCICIPASASTYPSFTVRAVIPEIQVDKSLTYFDLRMQPGDKQTVQVVVRNGGDETINARLTVNSATTGRNGIILYEDGEIRDLSLELPITEIAQPENPVVTVPAHGEVLANISLEMPKVSFDGCVLGGIQIIADAQNNTGEATQEGKVQIANNYVYTIGLKVTQNDRMVLPDMHLNSIEPELINYRPGVAVNLQNSEAAIIKGMNISGQVFEKNNTDPIRTVDLDNVNVAPQSNFDVVIDWDNRPLSSGDYRLKMRAQHNEQVWEWDERFSIEPTASERVNRESVALVRDNNALFMILAAIIIALIAIIILMFWKRRREDSV